MDTKKILMGVGIPVLAVGVAASVMAAHQSRKRTIPVGAHPVYGFELDRYLGRWYEVARFDYKWERGLSNVTAEYSLKDNGDVKVVNRGYDNAKGKWEESTGKAKPVHNPEVGLFKVSFFGPFYSGYNVIAIDKDYKYALVYGESTDYLWLLSREKSMPQDVIDNYLKQAAEDGYDLTRIIWTHQD